MMDGSPRILVTGAEGFVGSWMIARLRDALPGAEMMGAGAAGGPALDVTHAAEVDALIQRFRPTAVIHLAGVASPVRARAEPRAAWDINLFGTMNLAEAVMRHAPDARFVQAGSSEVYGGSFNAAGGSVDEGAPLAPLNPYATTKAAADLLLGEMAEGGLDAVRIRPFNHTGPGQMTTFAVPAFAAQIAAIERGEREPVGESRAMPAGSTERIHLFLPPYGASDRAGPGGGSPTRARISPWKSCRSTRCPPWRTRGCWPT